MSAFFCIWSYFVAWIALKCFCLCSCLSFACACDGHSRSCIFVVASIHFVWAPWGLFKVWKNGVVIVLLFFPSPTQLPSLPYNVNPFMNCQCFQTLISTHRGWQHYATLWVHTCHTYIWMSYMLNKLRIVWNSNCITINHHHTTGPGKGCALYPQDGICYVTLTASMIYICPTHTRHPLPYNPLPKEITLHGCMLVLYFMMNKYTIQPPFHSYHMPPSNTSPFPISDLFFLSLRLPMYGHSKHFPGPWFIKGQFTPWYMSNVC